MDTMSPLVPSPQLDPHARDCSSTSATCAAAQADQAFIAMAIQAQVELHMHYVVGHPHDSQAHRLFLPTRVPTNWQAAVDHAAPTQQQNGVHHPSFLCGIAHIPMHLYPDVRVGNGSQQEQRDQQPLCVRITSSADPSLPPETALAAIVSYLPAPSHSPAASLWIPTPKALLLTDANPTLVLPTATAAIRVEFWPISTFPKVRCLCATPVHVKVLALSRLSEPAGGLYPSPASTLSSTHTSPAMGHATQLDPRTAGSHATWSRFNPSPRPCPMPPSLPRGVVPLHVEMDDWPCFPAPPPPPPPPRSSSPWPATLGPAVRGVSVLYTLSGPDPGPCPVDRNDAGHRLRVAIIKTPVGLKDFVHEF